MNNESAHLKFSSKQERYTLSLPKAYSARGADMGRSEYGLHEYRALGTSTPKLHLTRVALDNGGYDRGGAYWGNSEQAGFLYCAKCDLNDSELVQTTPVRLFVRAWDHKQAQQEIRKQLKNARFYRKAE